MCVSAAVVAGVSLFTAAAGTALSISNANYQAGLAEIQLQEQRDALRQQSENLRLQGMEQELERIRAFEENRARNLAALAATTGFGQNQSYLQGVEKAEDKALKTDLTNIRLGIAGEQNRVAGQIRSTQFESKVNRANRNAAVTGSLLNFASSAVSAGQTYRTNK
jgi:hypothetical protein